MTDQEPDPASTLSDEPSFSVWTREKIRFQDVDRYGHVNNVAFSVYAESGRVDFMERVLPGTILGDGPVWVIVRLVIDFLGQAHYPGEVRIGTRVLRLGRSSVTLGQGLFEGGRCFATSEAVVVMVDPAGGGSLPLTEEVREVLGAYGGDKPWPDRRSG